LALHDRYYDGSECRLSGELRRWPFAAARLGLEVPANLLVIVGEVIEQQLGAQKTAQRERRTSAPPKDHGAWNVLLVEADTAANIAHLGNETRLLKGRLVVAGP